MLNVILQPCADKRAFDHFNDTIAGEVSTREIRKHLSNNDWNKFKSLYPEGVCRVWGVQAKKGGNIKKWERIRSGDIVYFYRHKTFIAVGKVTMTIHSKQLGRQLWGSKKRSTWEYIYFLHDVQPMAAPAIDFNLAIGYGPDHHIQGFTILDRIKSELALDYFGMNPLTEIEWLSDEDDALQDLVHAVRAQSIENTAGSSERTSKIAELTEKLAGLKTTDKKGLEYQRAEQSILTALLHLDDEYNTCAFCGQRFPVSFLVTAHIKKRAYCTHEERINPDIAMPLCTMGCDQLYEKGYITVRNGEIALLKRSPSSEYIKEYLNRVKGRSCSYFSELTRPFFEWHARFHGNR